MGILLQSALIMDMDKNTTATITSLLTNQKASMDISLSHRIHTTQVTQNLTTTIPTRPIVTLMDITIITVLGPIIHHMTPCTHTLTRKLSMSRTPSMSIRPTLSPTRFHTLSPKRCQGQSTSTRNTLWKRRCQSSLTRQSLTPTTRPFLLSTTSKNPTVMAVVDMVDTIEVMDMDTDRDTTEKLMFEVANTHKILSLSLVDKHNFQI